MDRTQPLTQKWLDDRAEESHRAFSNALLVLAFFSGLVAAAYIAVLVVLGSWAGWSGFSGATLCAIATGWGSRVFEARADALTEKRYDRYEVSTTPPSRTGLENL